LEQIIRSLKPMALLVAGAVVFVLGTAFLLASDATLPSSYLGASSDLAQAGRWLEFVGGACALGAVCVAGWELILRSAWIASAEIAAAAVGTLLITVGLLTAASSNGSSAAAPVTGAVGIGIWALLVLARAARVSLAEQRPAHAPGSQANPGGQGGRGSQGSQGGRGSQAELWLAAAVGLFVLAIGYGFSSAASSRGPGIAAGLLEAIGIGVLAGTVAAARSRGLLHSHPVPAVLAGLALLAASFLADAVVAGLAFGTLTGLGAGLTVVTAVELAGIIALGVAAWTRVRELYR
jgi:hypothetical protein